MSDSYSLESQEEFVRLEKQSSTPHHDFSSELQDFDLQGCTSILDAGCGSGIVSRYLAASLPLSQVYACDYSADRVQRAELAAQSRCPSLKNLSFRQEDITQLKYPAGQFERLLCRYVFAHLSADQQQQATQEFFRVLKPGGQIRLIDADGIFDNLFPQTLLVQEILQLVKASQKVDLHVGRKLPFLLSQAGFESPQWRIETIQCTDDTLQIEIELLKERLEGFTPFLKSLDVSDGVAKRFKQEYLQGLTLPGSVLFYNKFITTAVKPE